VFDLNFDIEVPIAKASPSRGKGGTLLARGLNKCAWEERRGGLIVTGGLDSVVSVFEVGRGLSGAAGEASPEEWMGVRRLVGRMAKGSSWVFMNLYNTSNNIMLRKRPHRVEGPSPRPRLTSLHTIVLSRVGAFLAMSQIGVLKQGTVQYLLAAAATLFMRAVQMFDETGGTSAEK
jgi:hypothetical protein